MTSVTRRLLLPMFAVSVCLSRGLNRRRLVGRAPCARGHSVQSLSNYSDHLLQVQFEVADVTKREFPAESFDVIFSRDTILHIEDKQKLFSSFYVSTEYDADCLIRLHS